MIYLLFKDFCKNLRHLQSDIAEIFIILAWVKHIAISFIHEFFYAWNVLLWIQTSGSNYHIDNVEVGIKCIHQAYSVSV